MVKRLFGPLSDQIISAEIDSDESPHLMKRSRVGKGSSWCVGKELADIKVGIIASNVSYAGNFFIQISAMQTSIYIDKYLYTSISYIYIYILVSES